MGDVKIIFNMSEPQTIELNQLPLPQSMAQLKTLQNKFTESNSCLSDLSQNQGKEVLVPLTSSMYVKGYLDDTSKVTCDIGTGFYIEQPVDNAKEYFERRVQFLTSQMEKIQPSLQEKYRMKEAVKDIFQNKIQLQLAAQQQSTAAASR